MKRSTIYGAYSTFYLVICIMSLMLIEKNFLMGMFIATISGAVVLLCSKVHDEAKEEERTINLQNDLYERPE